jgi:hypothetical protein
MGSTTDKVSGVANQAAGKVKETAGKATGSEKLEGRTQRQGRLPDGLEFRSRRRAELQKKRLERQMRPSARKRVKAVQRFNI